MKKPSAVKTLDSPLDAAEICRLNGWRKGTRLVGVEDGETQTIKITAVGEREILTKVVSGIGSEDDSEGLQDLSCREWRKVTK